MRPPPDLRPPVLDAVLALAFFALTLAEAAYSPAVPDPLAHVVFAGGAMLGLAWRRRFPLSVTAVMVAVNIAINPGGQFSTLLSLVLVCFTVGERVRPPRSYVGLAVVVVPFLVVSVVQGLEPSDLAAALVFFVGPWTVGVVLSGRLASADAALARAAQLEHERELEAVKVASAERNRIARELHDIVSHSISVVTISTQAVRRRLGPEHAREAEDLRAVEQTAREALAEMRRILGVLRAREDEDGVPLDLAPQPGLGELERLVTQVGSGAMRTRLRVVGDPVPLSPGMDLAAYRIAQEGLTNALRHARAEHAEVVLTWRTDRLDIEVLDDGDGPGPPEDPDQPGHGLVGIRERVGLYGGTMDLAPRPGGGARLAASLPVEGS